MYIFDGTYPLEYVAGEDPGCGAAPHCLEPECESSMCRWDGVLVLAAPTHTVHSSQQPVTIQFQSLLSWNADNNLNNVTKNLWIWWDTIVN